MINNSTRFLMTIVAAALAATSAHAQADVVHALPHPSLSISYADATQDGSGPTTREELEGEPLRLPEVRPEFGEAGYRSWHYGIGGGYGSNDVDGAATAFIGVEWFIADRFQFTTELSGWYFNQAEDAAAANLNFMFKYHFINQRDFSVFASAGAGLFAATEDVPRDGTPLNFSPRAGVGFTYRLNDRGLRLLGGVRWQHFSNARVGGADDNPGTDLLQGYIGLSMPF